MLRRYSFLLVLLLAPGLACAQAVATLAPAQPASLSDSVTVTFDATRGDRGLADWPGDVYAYTGVITPASTSPTDWQHVQSSWTDGPARLRLRALGGHRYRLTLQPSSFYGLAAGERVLQFAFVFKNADGSHSGRNANGSDVLLPLYGGSSRAYAYHRWQGGELTVVASDSARLTVQPWAAGVARVAFYPAGVAAVPAASLAVSAAPSASGATLAETATRLVVAGPGLSIELAKNPLRLRYLRGPQDTVLVETPGYVEVGGMRGVRFGLKADEALYGTGARAVPTNRRGQRVALYNQAHYGYGNGETNLNVSIPLVLGGRGFGVLFDEVRPGYLDLGQADNAALEYGTEADHLTYFVLAQKTLPALLAAYTDLTGHQPLPPRWALGYLQSKYGYQTEAEARAIVQRMRAAGFPLSGLVLDLYWFGDKQLMGNLDWDRRRFANAEGMMQDFDALGVKTILIAEPYVTQQSGNYASVAAGGLLARTSTGAPYVLGNFWAGSAGLLDLTNPAAQAWLWPWYKARTRQGAGGWWSDLGEPETHPDDMRHYAGATARQVHNGFANQWATVLQNGYAQDFPQQRLFNLGRSGFAGMQRLGITPWSGDVQRSWSGLQAQVPVMLGMGLSGEGYMHADAGGFTGGGQDNELYTRWLQYAAFTPIMRAHGEGVPTEPVNYPQPYQGIVRDYARLRQRLLPYTYTLAWENSETGAPLARPLNFNYQLPVNNQQLLDDSYLWGSDLLVAPVLNPGQTQRTVALPTGSEWVDYWTGTRYAGGSTATVAAPLARLPLLVRAGALLPTQPYRPSAALGVLDSLQVTYYPAATASTGQVYDDDGRTPHAYALGQYQLLHFAASPASASDYTLVATASGAGYAGSPARRVLEYLVPSATAPGAVLLQGQSLPLSATAATYAAADSGAYFDASAKLLRVRLRWRHQPVTVRVRGLALATSPVAAPLAAGLNAPYPNPFAASTTLSCEVAAPGVYQLKLYDLSGRLLRTLPVQAAAPGSYAVRWDGADALGRPLPTGIYVVALGGQHQRVTLLR